MGRRTVAEPRYLGSLYGRAALGGSAPTDHYDFVAAVADGLDALPLAAEHKRNWLVWADDVEAWSVRRGRMASRLLVRLTDGSRRKVLWAQYSRNASVFQDVEEALTTCLGPH
jgi:hypothetical protein